MVLLDFSGTMYADIAVNLRQNCGTKTDIDYLRHLLLNSIRSYNKQFKAQYGELVICMDAVGGNWRKQIFPHYKAARKKARIDSGIDWKAVFDDVDKISQEIEKYLPYKVIRVDELEADDVIAILAKNAEQICETDITGDMRYPVLIVSNDKDFAQLHSIPYVKQYKPRTGNIFKEKNPDFALTDLILHGDKSDGIPNIRSADDTFVTEGKRQSAVTSLFVRKFLAEGYDGLTDFEKGRYDLNKKLISFEEIPCKYTVDVLEAYRKPKSFNKMEMFQYFCSKGLNQVLDKINDF